MREEEPQESMDTREQLVLASMRNVELICLLEQVGHCPLTHWH